MTKQYSHKKSLTTFNVATAIVVVTLHGVTAAALVNMNSPKPPDQQPDDILPMEVQLISPPAESKPEPEAELKPAPKPDTAPKVVTKAKVEQEPKPKAKPVFEPEPVKPPAEKPPPEPKPEPKTEPKLQPKPAPKPEVNTVTVDNSNSEIKQQAAREQAAREQAAREQAAREQAAREQAAGEQAAREQAAREQAAREQAAREQAAREQAAREQAAREQAAASNTPISVSASEASWQRAPNISLSKRTRSKVLPGDSYSVLLKMTVDKQGNIQNVAVVSSSGNALVDKDALKAVNRAKFNPFKRNGMAVVGIVELPINVNVD
ncbi:energy transducer TonB [Psychrobacter fulvigenes]|uniref:energy transducer TonB n=1 Tax=Psychrobacter fulvigenes TaxID=533323 RepID=UPI001919AAF0|nr:energy transducer TonB [Psychrobacter fulvigenes]